MPDNGGYIKGIMRRVGVKKGDAISEQENEIFKDTYDEAKARFTLMAIDWWEKATGFEATREWDEEGHRIFVSWVAGDTRTEVEIWLERAE